MAAPTPQAVLAALGLPEPDAAQAAPGGQDTDVWRVQIEGAPYALRLLRADQGDRAAREAAAMAAASAAGLPVPPVRLRGQWEDRPVLLMDWCRGRTLVAALRERPAAARRLGRLFGERQADLHRIPAPAPCAADWLRAGGPEGAAVQRRLEGLPARRDALIHLDYHPANVLTDGAAITGIIDWANTAAGDPRADLARTLTILRLDAQRPGFLPPLLRAALLRFDLGWREGYARASGLAVDASLAPFYAWAALAMVRDLDGRRDPSFLRRVRSFARRWAARAGIR